MARRTVGNGNRRVFLKKITLDGFKSFADRTEFDFGPGITSIVGPNGCGKSNILDAVRWVLGEQSARSLRGSKMADVIFAGSRSRKGGHFAEVALTFDNRSRLLTCDHDEVVVGRTLYSSGESEYRLNGSVCRLKDVRDLLLDTGVGVDAYSIIEQGRVDVLLAASPVERREIFEEAAGISRYKVRRAEALRKLERTQQNLLRLNDVVDELEKRLRSVRLAAGKARNYQQYDGRLRELRSAFALAEYHDLSTLRGAHLQRAAALSDEVSARRAELAALDASAAENEHALQALDDRIRTADAEVQTLQSEAAALAERIGQGDRRLVELAEARERRLAQVGELEGRLRALDERIAAEERGLAELRQIVSEQDARGELLREARAAAQARSDEARCALEHAKTAAFDAVRMSSLLNNERNNLQQQNARMAAQAEQWRARAARLRQERDELFARREVLAARGAELEQAADAATASLTALESESKALEQASEEQRQAIATEKESRSAVLSRLGLLEDMERRYEGVDAGTRGVLEWRGDANRGGVVGLVADCLRIDDPRVGLLQGVLSTFENQVVVRDACGFLAELARRGELAGPVGVLALDRVAGDRAWVSYGDAPGFVARAADWVHCADEFRGLAEHLLGRVVIVDVMERALALSSSAGDGYVFVTLDGDIVASGGRLTVGARRGEIGLINRKAEIRQLRVELDEIEGRLLAASRRRSGLEQALADIELRRDSSVTEIAATQRQQAETRAELARADDESRRIDREAGLLAGDLAAADRVAAEIVEQLGRLAAESDAAEQQQRSHAGNVEALAAEQVALERDVSAAAQRLTEALVELGRAKERWAACEEAVRRLHEQRDGLTAERRAIEHEASQAASRIELARNETAAAQARLADVTVSGEQAQAAALALRESRQELRRQLESCGAATRALHHDIERLDAALHECQMALREFDVRTDNLTVRTRDELGLDLNALYASYEHAEQDWEAIKSEIEELRGKIARLGNVNLDSIAELDELTPRYENMVTQRSDLTESVARLQTLIAEIDQESRTRFALTFEAIRTHFQELFRKLFGGGKADIILEDPSNALECGIEIIARPPGKEPQTISLLSGGEKTMTAVALLLAVFKSRPSPFAILDEVDAALDESNVGRFNSVLEDFLTQSQFIVITHSKRTMQCADVLYGITMEEPGVSKRVSVRFEESVQAPIVA